MTWKTHSAASQAAAMASHSVLPWISVSRGDRRSARSLAKPGAGKHRRFRAGQTPDFSNCRPPSKNLAGFGHCFSHEFLCIGINHEPIPGIKQMTRIRSGTVRPPWWRGRLRVQPSGVTLGMPSDSNPKNRNLKTHRPDADNFWMDVEFFPLRTLSGSIMQIH